MKEMANNNKPLRIALNFRPYPRNFRLKRKLNDFLLQKHQIAKSEVKICK
jgi:hypothetical protein